MFNISISVPYGTLSCSNYIESSSLPRSTKGLWSHEEAVVPRAPDNTSSSRGSNNMEGNNKQDLSELFTKLGLTKYTSVFQQQEVSFAFKSQILNQSVP